MDDLRSEQSHLVSRNHPQMPMLDRNAQFAPFAALTNLRGGARGNYPVNAKGANWTRRRPKN